MAKLQPYSRKVGEFIDWLSERRVVLAKWNEEEGHNHRLEMIRTPTEQLLADFFGINLVKTEQEKRAILAGIRSVHEAKEPLPRNVCPLCGRTKQITWKLCRICRRQKY